MKNNNCSRCRPQIIKAAAISRAIENNFPAISRKSFCILVSTTTKNMSEVFFEELNIPKPTINLNRFILSAGNKIAKMIEQIEDVLVQHKPSNAIVFARYPLL